MSETADRRFGFAIAIAILVALCLWAGLSSTSTYQRAGYPKRGLVQNTRLPQGPSATYDSPPEQDRRQVALRANLERLERKAEREDAQRLAIARSLISQLPAEFKVHLRDTEVWGTALRVHLDPKIKEVFWSMDCGIKYDMMKDLTTLWRGALTEAAGEEGKHAIVDLIAGGQLLAQSGPIAGITLDPRCIPYP